MSVIPKLSSSLGTSKQGPNEKLAAEIAEKKDKKAIKELIDHLGEKKLQGDCIKVLYETGERVPELIAPYDKVFLELLSGKNNRLAWGAMTALDCIASVNPAGMFKQLPLILKVADEGSVITRDHAVNILIKLSEDKKYSATTLPLLLEQMKTCPTNQLPKYGEDSVHIITDKYKPVFVKALTARLSEYEKETKRVRLEKVIKKLMR
jgi:hypothetical protein